MLFTHAGPKKKNKKTNMLSTAVKMEINSKQAGNSCDFGSAGTTVAQNWNRNRDLGTAVISAF